MQVSLYIAAQNNLFNFSYVNNHFNQDNKSNKDHKQDTLSISALGKANSVIETLMKQKQNVIDHKNELISNTLDSGGNMDSIKSQLECYDEQLKNIDNQIKQVTIETSQQQIEKQKAPIAKASGTEQDTQTAVANVLISTSACLKQQEVLSSVKSKTDGEINVLKTQMKFSTSHGVSFESKRGQLSELQQRSAELTDSIDNGFSDKHTDETKSEQKSYGITEFNKRFSCNAEAGTEAD